MYVFIMTFVYCNLSDADTKLLLSRGLGSEIKIHVKKNCFTIKFIYTIQYIYTIQSWTRSNNPIRTYVIVSERKINRSRSWLLKLTNCELVSSERNKSYQNVSTPITSYQNLKCQRNSTISYEWPIMAIVTDRTTVGTQHKHLLL